MANRILSIEIGYMFTKVCEIEYKLKKPKVYQCFDFLTPKDMLEDGYVIASDEFTQTLKDKCREYGVKTKKVVFPITSTKIASREVLIPHVKENRIKDVVAANAGEYFPVDISNYQLANTVLEVVPGKNKDEKYYKLLVLIAPNDLLDSYFGLAKSCGLSIVAIDYSGNSIYQAVKNQLSAETNLVIKVDERTTLLTVIRNQSIVLQRIVNYGADSGIMAIMDHKSFGGNVSYIEALNELRNKPYIRNRFAAASEEIQIDYQNQEEVIEGQSNEINSKTQDGSETDITESLHMLVNSIIRVIDYYNSRNVGMTIDSIVLTGLGGDFKGFNTLLSYELGQTVVKLEEIHNINFEKVLQTQSISIGEYLNSAGAVLAPIDFISQKLKPKKAKQEKESIKIQEAILIFAGGLLISAVFIGISLYSYNTAANTKKSLEAKVLEYQQAEKVYNNYNTVKQLYDGIQIMDSMIATPNEYLVDFIDELEEKMPSEINVLSFTANQDSVAMNINVGSKEAAAKVIVQLRSFGSISNVEISGITEVANENGQKIVSFSVNCVYADQSSLDAAYGNEKKAE